MALLEQPSIIRKGDENVLILDQSELLLIPKVANNNHYSNTNRWRFIVIQYRSSPNGNVEKVSFTPNDEFTVDPLVDPTIDGIFAPSGFAENDFNVEMISIFGFDNSSLDIYREDLTTQDLLELDINLTDSYGFFSYSLNDVYGLQSLEATPIENNLSVSMWFKSYIPQSIGGGDFAYLMSLDNGSGFGEVNLYINSLSQLVFTAQKSGGIDTQVVNGVNLSDGNWHSIVLAFGGTLSHAETRVFVDGVKEQEITGIDQNPAKNIYLGNPTAGDLSSQNWGPRGYVAQVEVWNNYFDTPQAIQYHNSGSVLNPNLHQFANDLVNDWTFGDNFSDDGSIVTDNKNIVDLTVLASGVAAPFKSGSSEPNWSTEIGLPTYNQDALVTDNEIIWSSFPDDSSAPPQWSANTVFSVNDVVQPTTPNGYLFVMVDNARIRNDQP